MSTENEDRVLRAIAELKSAISAFVRFYELPDERVYPARASAEDIRQLAVLMGGLPPSFRIYLSIHQSFPEVDGNCDLLPPAKIQRMTDLAVALRDRIEQQLPDHDLGSLFVIGRPATRNNSLILFDRSTVTDEGEWAVVEVDGKIGWDGTHPDFVTFLESTAENMREAIAGEEDWRDLIDV